MKDLRQMSYEEFGKLRFLDFFPQTETYFNDDVGGTTCSIGYGAVDGYGFTGFVSPTKHIGATSEIALDFGKDCPESEGKTFLQHLGLKLQKGMSVAEIVSVLGLPPNPENPNSQQYVVGTTWPYYLGLVIEDGQGLQKVWICRKDLADKETKYRNEI